MKGMKGAPSPVSTPLTSLGATCQGACVLTKLDGSNRMLAGTANKLYEAATSTWTDVSRAATYTASGTGRWRFAQFGNTSLATNGSDTLQASTSGAFSCVGSAPPAAQCVEVVGGFVFLANTTNGTNVVQWAGINGYTSWTASVATQAGSDTLYASPGAITGIKRFGSYLVVYKKNSMYLGVYQGPPNIWAINANLIPGEAGALSQEAIVNVGTPEDPKHIFMGEDNFYMYDGSKPVPIGSNLVRRTVFNALLQSRASACMAMHDKANNVVYFYYPVADSQLPDKCVVYNYRTDKWGVDDRKIQFAFQYVSSSITYDNLGGSYSTYDVLPTAEYDLAFLNSAQFLPAIFDTNNNLKTLSGASSTSSFTTGDMGNDQQVTTVTRIRPRFITAPLASSWTHYSRMNTGDTLYPDTAVSLSSSGAFDLLRSARWHRGTMSFTGDWEMAGFSPEWAEDGLE